MTGQTGFVGEQIQDAALLSISDAGVCHFRWDDDPAHVLNLPATSCARGSQVGDTGVLTRFKDGPQPQDWAWRFEPYPKDGPVQSIVPSSLVKVTPVGAKVLFELSYAEWSAQVSKMWDLYRAMPFILGDLIAYGEHRWGHTYDQALDATDYEYDTLASFVWVCSNVPFEIRRPSLTFEHHKAVARSSIPIKDKVHYLELAEQKAPGFESARAMKQTIRDRLGLSSGQEKMACPICGELEWNVKALHGVTCGHCDTHADELVRQLLDLTADYDDLLAELQQARQEIAALERARKESHVPRILGPR